MQDSTQEILDAIINAARAELIKNPELTKESFHKIKNDIYKGYDIPKPFPSIRILERYDERVDAGEFEQDDIIRRLFRKRGVRRAELNKFDPVLQIHNRLRALEVTGHKIEKNDVRII